LVKYAIFACCILPACYVHLRGRVRLRPWRQLTDHSTFLAPLNVLLYACSRIDARPHAPLDAFPELAPLAAEWRTIRDEALALREAQRIRASDRYDDAASIRSSAAAGSASTSSGTTRRIRQRASSVPRRPGSSARFRP
jgi:aspartyl/asparaginyl beta-hydroxylase (cupin superfamily)